MLVGMLCAAKATFPGPGSLPAEIGQGTTAPVPRGTVVSSAILSGQTFESSPPALLTPQQDARYLAAFDAGSRLVVPAEFPGLQQPFEASGPVLSAPVLPSAVIPLDDSVPSPIVMAADGPASPWPARPLPTAGPPAAVPQSPAVSASPLLASPWPVPVGPAYASAAGSAPRSRITNARAVPVREPLVREPLAREQSVREQSVLVESDVPAVRSEQLERIACQSDRQIMHGFELAGREAYFAARSEFIVALRLVAQGLDTERQTTAHSRALATGLTAMHEAEDFLPSGTRLEADLQIAHLIAGHRTPVLKAEDASTLTPAMALRSYFTFAQEQLAAAAGHEVSGSTALYALGKLHSQLAQQKSDMIRAAEPKAMVFLQAALLVFPQNHMAANDLGVLLARSGNYADAKNVLEQSLLMQQSPTGWHNLAVVYGQLGDQNLASLADRRSTAASRATSNQDQYAQAPSKPVAWVDPRAFAAWDFGTAPSSTPTVAVQRVSPPAVARRQVPPPAIAVQQVPRPAVAAGPAQTIWLKAGDLPPQPPLTVVQRPSNPISSEVLPAGDPRRSLGVQQQR